MKMRLPEPDTRPLKPAELVDLADNTRQARELMQETHDAYKRRADKMRAEIASRYNGEAFHAISPAARRRVAEHKTAVRVTALRQEALASHGRHRAASDGRHRADRALARRGRRAAVRRHRSRRRRWLRW